MKNTIRLTLSFTFAAALLFAAGTLSPAFGQSAKDANQGNDSIIDVWLTTVTPTNCETGDPVAPSFNSMLTLNRGGTMAEYGANPNTPFRSPGHGKWQAETGRNVYSMSFTFFALTPAGIPVGRIRVEHYVDLNGEGDEEMQSYGAFELRDFNGNILATGCTTATGRRFN
jgi:hypothetical protein